MYSAPIPFTQVSQQPSTSPPFVPPGITSDDITDKLENLSMNPDPLDDTLPLTSQALHSPLRPHDIPRQTKITFRQNIRDDFKKTLPTEVQLQLDQPFGKPRLSASFTSEACLRHTLIHLYRGGFLDLDSRNAFHKAFPLAQQLTDLLHEFDGLDFTTIRGFASYENCDSNTVLNTNRIRLHTAACLHFNGNVHSLVRYLGGPHVAAHRNHKQILAKLKRSVNPKTHAELARIFYDGSPNQLNASASDANLHNYFKYGNHGSATNNPDSQIETLLKDTK